MWEESYDLNAQRGDHPISSSTITGMPRRGDTTGQHALVMLRWLGQPPENFIAQPRPGTTGVALPAAGPAHRLRWNLTALYNALNATRRNMGAHRYAAALHTEPAHRIAHGEVCDLDAPGHVNLPIAEQTFGRLHPPGRLVAQPHPRAAGAVSTS
jgi:hypothetical protein